MSAENGNRPLNERIRAARLAAGMSQRVLAEKLGTSERRVAAWEAGENAPGPHYAKRLAEETGQPPLAFKTDRAASRSEIERRFVQLEEAIGLLADRIERLAG